MVELRSAFGAALIATLTLAGGDSLSAKQSNKADLEAIDFDGVLRRVADKLLVQMNDGASEAERLCAQEALIQLYLMQAAPAGAEAA